MKEKEQKDDIVNDIIDDSSSIIEQQKAEIETLKIQIEDCKKKYNHDMVKVKEETQQQLMKIRFEMNDRINETTNGLNNSFNLKEKKLVTKVCTEMLTNIEAFKGQLLAYYTKNNEELQSMIMILDINMSNMLGDLEIFISNVKKGDEFDSSKHSISSIINTDDKTLDNTIAAIINKGFTYKSNVLLHDVVQVYKFVQ